MDNCPDNDADPRLAHVLEGRTAQEPSIPYLHTMERYCFVSGNTTTITPEVRTKAIPTSVRGS
jgi:hypothetical protein